MFVSRFITTICLISGLAAAAPVELEDRAGISLNICIGYGCGASTTSTGTARPTKVDPAKISSSVSSLAQAYWSTTRSSVLASKYSTTASTSSKATSTRYTTTTATSTKPTTSAPSTSSKRSSSTTTQPSSTRASSTRASTSTTVRSSSRASSTQATSTVSRASSTRALTTVVTSARSSSASSTTRASSTTIPAPVSTGCASAGGDAPYSLSCGQLGSVITFPNGFQNKPGGIVFLVHGTGSTGEETWATGPYNTILPGKGIGYDIAWFTSPTRSLEDAQVTAEYIAYNVGQLAKQSRTGKVFIIGHSQGNLNIQWALNFWPSIRSKVSGFVSIAGDFYGTAEGPLVCIPQDLIQGGCEPSVVQQTVGSRYLAASQAKGSSSFVPTTSVYTLYDDIIQPELINPTSRIGNSLVVPVQQLCTLLSVNDHFTMTVTAPAFFLAYDALTHGGQASLSRFNPLTDCSYLLDAQVPNPFVTVPGLIRQAALDFLSLAVYQPKITSEPLLMDYVCKRGDASSYCVSNVNGK